MEPGSGAETEDVVCISPFSSRSSFLLRLHFYACFIAASYYIPTRGGQILQAADTAFWFHVSIATVEIWKTTYQLFTVRTAAETLDLDLFYAARVVLLGLFLHAAQIVRLRRYEARTHNCAASQNHRLNCYFAASLFITGLVGVIAHSIQRGAAERSLPVDESSCASHHGHLVKRDFRGMTDLPLLRALRPIATISYLFMDLFHACLQYRAFLSRPKSNREGNKEEEKSSMHGEPSPSSRNGIGKNDCRGMEKVRPLATDDGHNTLSNGHRDPPPWRPPIWLFLGHWRHAAIIRTCLLPEMCYDRMVGIGADLYVGTLSHWIIWGITAAYLAAEIRISYFRAPEGTGEEPLA